ncbi:MAG TPA: DUF1127 domain-containing protein [Alphaproteobacteria bacterium]
MRNSYLIGPLMWAPAPRLARLAGVVERVAATVRLFHARARERRELLAMSDRDLRDIGLTRLDAWREANKPLWRS